MDQCASVLLAFPPDHGLGDDEQYDRFAKLHVQRVGRLLKEQASTLAVHASQLLDHIDPAVNSMSYLILLQSLFFGDSRPSQISQDLLHCAANFFLTFDARQIRYAGHPFSNFLTLFELGDTFPASVSVKLMTTALLKIDPTGSILTSHHLPLIKLAYVTDNLESVLPLINKSVVYYPGMKGRIDSRPVCDMRLPPSAYVTIDSGLTSKLNSANILEYDLLCGLSHIQQRSWQAAFDALERVITYPTKDNGCSKIMAEAHNKWLLVGLLLRGKAPIIPSIAGQGAQRAYQTLGKPYAALARAFERGDEGGAAALRAEFDAGGGPQFWHDDGANLGLVREVLAHYQRWQILNLRFVYAKVSLEDIRARTQSGETGGPMENVADAEELVQDMIADGMLAGEIRDDISGGGGKYLVFLPDPTEELPEAQFAAELLATAERVKRLEPVLRTTNERLGASKEYVKYLVKEQKRERDNVRDPGVGFDSQIEDEDLMTGIMAGH